MSFFPTEEQALRKHRLRNVKVTDIKVGDRIEIAGWPAIVTFVDSWSDDTWYLSLAGHDGDPHNPAAYTMQVKLPSNIKVQIRRHTSEGN